MKKALFLDRDGVINEDIEYPHKPQHIIFKPGIFTFCKAALKKGYIIVVVTNQAGIAKGYFTEDDVKSLHVWMRTEFEKRGIKISGFYYCPYHKDAKIEEYKRDSDCRKPKPGMFKQASMELDIDIRRSIMIGDKPSDRIELDGLKSHILRGKYSENDYDVENLTEARKLL
jgi:D-glycero-D-manno-heptose 1,7-bisphosphate phosphatase